MTSIDLTLYFLTGLMFFASGYGVYAWYENRKIDRMLERMLKEREDEEGDN